MAVNDEFAGYVLSQMGDLEDVTIKKMFGGGGIYSRGRIFGLVVGAVLYLKVDDTNRHLFEEKGMKPFKPFEDRPMVMSYFEVPADVIEDPELLQEWSRRSLEVSARAKGKRRF
ncbi:competence protein TfoX [Thermoplasmatales archaeon ex4484_6]|nr:MAG: competence protein TfoX [Thermoplasmatales archaeon ex4484_6]RLF67000.1 MAG: competence protein TfoX [Thermoplasmata archaeon]